MDFSIKCHWAAVLTMADPVSSPKPDVRRFQSGTPHR